MALGEKTLPPSATVAVQPKQRARHSVVAALMSTLSPPVVTTFMLVNHRYPYALCFPRAPKSLQLL